MKAKFMKKIYQNNSNKFNKNVKYFKFCLDFVKTGLIRGKIYFILKKVQTNDQTFSGQKYFKKVKWQPCLLVSLGLKQIVIKTSLLMSESAARVNLFVRGYLNLL